jgi:hypothetical protein
LAVLFYLGSVSGVSEVVRWSVVVATKISWLALTSEEMLARVYVSAKERTAHGVCLLQGPIRYIAIGAKNRARIPKIFFEGRLAGNFG